MSRRCRGDWGRKCLIVSDMLNAFLISFRGARFREWFFNYNIPMKFLITSKRSLALANLSSDAEMNLLRVGLGVVFCRANPSKRTRLPNMQQHVS